MAYANERLKQSDAEYFKLQTQYSADILHIQTLENYLNYSLTQENENANLCEKENDNDLLTDKQYKAIKKEFYKSKRKLKKLQQQLFDVQDTHKVSMRLMLQDMVNIKEISSGDSTDEKNYINKVTSVFCYAMMKLTEPQKQALFKEDNVRRIKAMILF